MCQVNQPLQALSMGCARLGKNRWSKSKNGLNSLITRFRRQNHEAELVRSGPADRPCLPHTAFFSSFFTLTVERSKHKATQS